MTVVNVSDVDVTGVYREFLRVPALSLGVYRHGVGVDVPQEPHSEDEVYYVIDGDRTISIDGAEHAVRNGSVVYVGGGLEFLRDQPAESFDLVFADAMPGKYEGLDDALSVVKTGGF
jgi:mannose-6-phosphate isomerase-like protein (cupin superfamily)